MNRFDDDFRSLPPLPDSPVMPTTTMPTTRVFPNSPFQIRPSGPGVGTEGDKLHVYSSSSVEQSHQAERKPIGRSPTKHTDNYLPSSRLLRSPAKHLSPAKIPLPPSPTRPILDLHKQIADRALSPEAAPAAGDESFLMPQSRHENMNISLSMIGDMSMPDLMSVEMDDSTDYKAGSVRESRTIRNEEGNSPRKPELVRQRDRSPIKADRARPLPTPSRTTRSPIKPPASSSPSKVKRTFPASSSHNHLSRLGEEAALDVSTIFPRSPTRFGHLMGDEHQILRQSLPMSEEGDSILFASPPMPTVRKTPRTQVGDMDASTILPRSPTRMAHLMGDDYQLMRQSLPMSEGDSLLIPSPPPPIMPRRTPKKQASPTKDSDMTLDVGQMMARMAKPKRPSGTEESFEDLMHGPELDLDE